MNENNKYFLDQLTLVVTPTIPSDMMIMCSITEANRYFTLEENIEHKFIVCAEIKPIDKLVQGIKWKELRDRK